MDANKNLLAGYQEIANENVEWRSKNMPSPFEVNELYERLLDMMTNDAAQLEALKLTPHMKITLGMYIKSKEDHEALKAMETLKAATSGS